MSNVDTELALEARRFSAELDAANRVHRDACNDIAGKYMRRYTAIGNGEAVKDEPSITLIRAAGGFGPMAAEPAPPAEPIQSGFRPV